MRYPRANGRAALGVLVLSVCALLGFRAVSAERVSTLETGPAVDPSQAMGMLITPHWSVWRTIDLRGDRTDQERHSRWVRYYRQRSGADRSQIIFETHDTSLKPMAVLADGTVVLAQPNQNHLLMVDRRGAVYETDLSLENDGGHEPVMITAVVEDGVVVQPRRAHGGRGGPLLLIPFRDGRPDPAAAITLTDDPIAMRPQRSFGRAWPELAWADERGLFMLDLVTHEVREVPFDGELERGFDEVRAFDGRFVVLRRHIVDTETGKSIARFNDNRPITLHDGVYYEMIRDQGANNQNQLSIIARDLTHDPDQAHELIRFDWFTIYWQYNSRRSMMPNMAPDVIEPLPEGLRVFDGKQWVIVPYFDRDAPAGDDDAP